MKDNAPHTPTTALDWQSICAYLLLSAVIVLGLYAGLNRQLQTPLGGALWLFAFAALAMCAGAAFLHHIFASRALTRLTDEMEHQIKAEAAKAEAAKAEAAKAEAAKQASPPPPAEAPAQTVLPAAVNPDMRTPVKGIIGMTNKLLKSPLSDDQKRYMLGIQKAVYTLNKMVDAVQASAEPEPQQPALDNTPFNLVQTIEACLNVLADPARAKRLSFFFCMMSGVPQQVRGDAKYLQQILANLLAHAIKSTEAGTVAISVSGDIEDNRQINLRFDIHSTATHIDSAHVPRLSRTFPQMEMTSSQFLAPPEISRIHTKQLVQLLKGRIEVQRQPDTGTIWRLELSLGLGPNYDAVAAPLPLQHTPILYVDSCELNGSLMFNQFTSWGMAPTTVVDADAALSALDAATQQNNPFPLVVMRHDPDTLDGYALCRDIRSAEAATAPKLIMLTATGNSANPLGASSSVDASLTFPIRVTTLHHALLQVADHTETSAAAKSEPAPPPPEAQASSSATMHILLVEDNHVNQQVALSMLKKWGHQVDIAWNGLEALAAVQKQRYDLVLMDIQMPEMDGVTATQQIRQLDGEPAAVPIVAVTANAMQGDRERFLEAGMDDYIAKPINRDTFYMVVHRYAPQQPTASAEQPQTTPASGSATPVLGDDVLGYLMEELSGETVSELIDEYMTHSSALLSQALTASETQDAKNIEYAVHTLKGMSGALGAFRMVDICQHILDSCRSGGAQQIGDQLTGLTGATEEAQQALQAWRTEHES